LPYSGVIVGGAGTDMANSAGGIKMMGLYYTLISNETKASLVKNSYSGWPLYAEVRIYNTSTATVDNVGVEQLICWLLTGL